MTKQKIILTFAARNTGRKNLERGKEIRKRRFSKIKKIKFGKTKKVLTFAIPKRTRRRPRENRETLTATESEIEKRKSSSNTKMNKATRQRKQPSLTKQVYHRNDG